MATYEYFEQLSAQDEANMEELDAMQDEEVEAEFETEDLDELTDEDYANIDEAEALGVLNLGDETETDVFMAGMLEISTPGNLDSFQGVINGAVKAYLGSIFDNENLQRIVVLVKFGVPVEIRTVRNAVKNIGKKGNHVFDASVNASAEEHNVMEIVFTRQDSNELPKPQLETKQVPETKTNIETKTVTETENGVFVVYRSVIDTTGAKDDNAANVRVFNTIKSLIRSDLDRENVHRAVVSVSFSKPTTSIDVYNIVMKVPPKYAADESFMFYAEVPESADGLSFDIIFTRRDLGSEKPQRKFTKLVMVKETKRMTEQETKEETKRVFKRATKRVIEQETKEEIAVDLGVIQNEVMQGDDADFVKNFPDLVRNFLNGKLNSGDTFTFKITTRNDINSESIKTLTNMTSITGFVCDNVSTSSLLSFSIHEITIRRKSSVRREPIVQHKPSGQRKATVRHETNTRDCGMPRGRRYEGYLGHVNFELRGNNVTDAKVQQTKLHKRAEGFMEKFVQEKPIGQVHAIGVKVGDLAACTDNVERFVFDALKNVLGNGYTAVRCVEEEMEGSWRVFTVIYRREGNGEEEL